MEDLREALMYLAVPVLTVVPALCFVVYGGGIALVVGLALGYAFYEICPKN